VPKLRLPFMGKGGKRKGSGARRVLVVEDEPSICQVCLRTLTGEGFKVDIAVNGASARDMLGKKEYDLCLIDIRTPIMNGQQLYQWISEQHPELVERLIFTTGDLMAGDTKIFLERTGRPFLAKPFTLDELKTVVSETLRQIKR
jgi:DNA-binding response OmpR family regulator